MSRIAVIGDFMRDIWWLAEPRGASQDSGCSRYNITQRLDMPGGAGNVAHNLCLMDNDVVTLGNNRYPCERIEKHRLLCDDIQVVRWDLHDYADPIGPLEYSRLDWPSFDGIVISDYAKGSVGTDVIDHIAHHTVGPVFIDSKQGPAPFTAINRKRIVFIPNHLEHEAHLELYNTYDTVIVKEGPHGCTLMDRGQSVCSCPAMTATPLSTCGAGDVVVAAIVTGMLRYRMGPGPRLLTYAMTITGESLNASRYTCQVHTPLPAQAEGETLSIN